MTQKQELRERLRETLSAISADELNARSSQVCHKLFESPEYAKAEAILVYLALPHEIDTTPLVLRAWQERKRILAPKISWNQRRMLPVEIRSLTDDVAVSQMGIREPVAGPPFPIAFIDLVIVPGLGFDEFGNRLGRGRGFYDRFLAHSEFQGIACALALEEQLLPTLPAGPLDRRIDMLITDERVLRFAK